MRLAVRLFPSTSISSIKGDPAKIAKMGLKK